MNKVFDKILERLILESSSCNVYKNIKPNTEDIAEFNAYKKCINIVKEIAAEYNGGWIPADEPPETDAYVLLSFANFTLPLVGRYDEEEACGGAYYIGDEVVSCVSQDLFVNAWMPLPEQYKGDE